jgi:hypothetical protein
MKKGLQYRRIVFGAVAAIGSVWVAGGVWAEAPAVQPRTVSPGFLAERRASGETKPAKDLSGISCRLEGQGQFRCLVVNDEAVFAQWATYDGRTLMPMTGADGFVELLGTTPPARAYDDQSSAGACAGGRHARFNEFDGEAIAWAPGPEAGGTYYVVGSHSCSRGDSEDGVPPRMKLSTQFVARVRMLAAGPEVDLTWRLGPALAAHAATRANYHAPLSPEGNGLDIEGAAVVGDRMYLGLRAPATDHTTVLGVSPGALFTPAPEPRAAVSLSAHRVALGDRVGIRDMAALPDGRLLVLSGPAQGQDRPFSLHVVRPTDAADWGAPAPIAAISHPTNPRAKAEGIAVLVEEGRPIRVLVVFENPDDGALELALPG